MPPRRPQHSDPSGGLVPGKWYKVASSNVRQIRWVARSKSRPLTTPADLYVWFHSGAVYAYERVPWSVFLAMYNAPSKGRFVWRKLRDRYATRRVG